MVAKSPGWSRLGKSTLALLAISILLILALTGHMIATGVGVPYQDPTPEQAAFERFHNPIAMSLMVGSALSILATLACGMAWILTRIVGKLRSI